jgi:DNA (cytosine-5)-methyltransferase 1
MVKHVGEPAPGIVSRPNVSLVVPYRRSSKPRTTDEPLHTVATHDSAALVEPAYAVEDCHFRMLQPREHLRAQRFHDAYVVHGNKSEQTMQAGNAVACNVAQWLGERIAAALDGHGVAPAEGVA